jgi:hypothetical protein
VIFIGLDELGADEIKEEFHGPRSEFTVQSSQFTVGRMSRESSEVRKKQSKGMSHHRGAEDAKKNRGGAGVSFFQKALRGGFLKRGPLSAWPPLRAKQKKKPLFSSSSLLR